MGNISSAFQDALATQAKAALADVVAANPRITVKDLSELVASNPLLGGLTLNQLLGGASASRAGRPRGSGRKASTAAPGAAAAPRKAAAASSDGAHKRNVRTDSGREAFDKEVLDALEQFGGENVSATQIRTQINADPTQLRASLNRMIEGGIVTFTGKARGTRYSLA